MKYIALSVCLRMFFFLRFKTFFILDEYNSVYTSFKAFAQNLVMTKTTTMTNTKTQTFRQHPQRASLETCDLKKKIDQSDEET